ncbi:hypothetical protein FJ208_02450 [Candidatus Gribaldobacteria bacterium]|nr:hypothetical protein [Candidatus Gribaldobacteria bacterium]
MARILEFSSDDLIDELKKMNPKKVKELLIQALLEEKKQMEKTGYSGWYRAVIALIRTALAKNEKGT